jgi:hypothetical protein
MLKGKGKKLPIKFLNEMEGVGISRTEILLFSVLGVGFWSVLTWLFVDRYQNIEDSTTKNDSIKDVNTTVLSFHLLTLVFTLLEAYSINKNIWISWFTIGLALTAVFLNGVVVSNSVSTPDGTDPELSYTNKNSSSKNKDIISLVLQVFAICLMTAYIFKLIRSKNKTMY